MKKEYVTPRVDRMEFNYTENVVAGSSQGFTLREYVQDYKGCNKVETDNWFLNFVRESSCQQL